MSELQPSSLTTLPPKEAWTTPDQVHSAARKGPTGLWPYTTPGTIWRMMLTVIDDDQPPITHNAFVFCVLIGKCQMNIDNNGFLLWSSDESIYW